MIILVLDDVDRLPDVMRAWKAAGAQGITVLESSGVARIVGRHGGARDDLPVFPSLSAMLSHQEEHHRTLFTIVGDDVDTDAFFDATEAVTGSLSAPHTGIIVALPVLAGRGYQTGQVRAR
jgi:hypothetical protein